MSRRAAIITQAEVNRILRAAKEVGAASVEMKVGEATVVVSLEKEHIGRAKKPVEL